jgi:hypothetical protein
VLRQVNDILGQISLIGFCVVAGLTPVVILVVSIVNFARFAARRVAILLKTLAALAIWVFLTFGFIMAFMVLVFPGPGYAARTQSDDLKVTVIFIVAIVIYALAGSGLIYWIKRQGKRSQTAPAS